MPRAIRLLPAISPAEAPPCDTLMLDHVQRRSGRGTHSGLKGTTVEFALEEPVRLRTDDRLLLDDGRAVTVVAATEPLWELRAETPTALGRAAWNLGDRHIPVELLPNRLRLRRDPSLASLLEALSVRVTTIEAPFEPEGGAYELHEAGHHHGHDHHHHDHHHGGHHHHDS